MFAAFGLLGTGPAQDSAGLVDESEFVVFDASRAPGLGCGVARELHFEMLPADAEPRLPPPRHGPVCLAVYRAD